MISDGSTDLAVTVTFLNKTATRHAEAMFLKLNPAAVSTMEMHKIGSWIELTEGLVVDGGNKAMHGVNGGVRFNHSAGAGAAATSMLLETLDAGVVVFGEPTGFPTSGPYGDQEPDLSKGVSSMMLNNLWGTNYVMWYPFEKEGQPVATPVKVYACKKTLAFCT